MSDYIVTRYPIQLDSQHKEVTYCGCDLNASTCYREHFRSVPIDGLHVSIRRRPQIHERDYLGRFIYCNDNPNCDVCLNELPF